MKIRHALIAVYCPVLFALVMLLGPSSPALASGAGIDLAISPGKASSQRFQWLHWWETKRPELQRAAHADQRAIWASTRAQTVEPYRERLVAAMVPIVKDTKADPYARAGATIALARMGYEKLVELIVSDQAPPAGAPTRTGPSGQSWPVGLVGDENIRVRVAGWLALGILDTEDSRDRLMDEFVWAVTDDDLIARTTAFGFLRDFDKKERTFLTTTMVNSKNAEVQRMALWAMSQHDSQHNDKVMQEAIAELRSPYSVAQAMLATESMQRLGTQKLMSKVISHPDQLTAINVFNQIERGTQWQSNCTFGVLKQLQVSALLALMELDPVTETAANKAMNKAIRFAMFEDSESRQASGVESPGRDRNDFDTGAFTSYQRGPAALALAMQATPLTLRDDIDALERLFEGYADALVQRYPLDAQGRPDKTESPVIVHEELQLPHHTSRGYAMVAMGLMLQRLDKDSALGKQQPLRLRSSTQLNRAVGLLSQHLQRAFENSRELTSVRSAAAIAMGLSGRHDFRKTLLAEVDQLGSNEVALYGYTVEALAMLDDTNAPELVERYLKQAGQVRNDNDLLARRALASALIFSQHTSEDVDTLVQSVWEHNPWAGLALSRSAAVKGDGQIIDYLLEQLKGSHAAAAAISLGDVVDTQTPWRMTRLTENMNYTLDYRTPVELGWNAYEPNEQTSLPTRLVTGFDDPLFVHVLLLQRMPTGASLSDLQNDDSNGLRHFMFRSAKD